MSDALNLFFDAWGTPDGEMRLAKIVQSCAADCTYSDPRSDGRLIGIDAIAQYVGMFSANAPGWTARVTSCDIVNDYARVIVAFGGMGPDGIEMIQHGTYFADIDNTGKITMIAGFVGTGDV